MDRPPNSPRQNDLPSSEHKASNVDAFNYYEKAKMFMQGAKKETGSYGVVIDPTSEPQLWGAWKAYFDKTGKRGAVARMNVLESNHESFKQARTERRASTTYLVPASMPSDFDENQDWYSDNRAGDSFIEKADARKRSFRHTESAEYRQQVVAKKLGYNPDVSGTGPKPGRIDSNWRTVV